MLECGREKVVMIDLKCCTETLYCMFIVLVFLFLWLRGTCVTKERVNRESSLPYQGEKLWVREQSNVFLFNWNLWPCERNVLKDAIQQTLAFTCPVGKDENRGSHRRLSGLVPQNPPFFFLNLGLDSVTFLYTSEADVTFTSCFQTHDIKLMQLGQLFEVTEMGNVAFNRPDNWHMGQNQCGWHRGNKRIIKYW